MQQLRTRFLPAIFLAVVFVFACAVGGLLKFGQYNPANAQAAAPETTPKGNLIPDTEFKFCCYYHGDKNLPFIVYHTRGNKPSAGGNATVPAIEQSYVFLPMPRLVKNNQNVSANSKGVNIEVEIELYPVDLSDEFLKQHRANVSTDVPLARVVPASLSTVALRVSPSYPALITFIPLLDPPVLPSRMKIEGKAPTADAAEKFVKDLQSGTARLELAFALPGHRFAENSLTISYENVTTAMEDLKLDGKGSEGKVSRGQVANVLRRYLEKRDIRIEHEFDDPAFTLFIDSTIRDFFKKDKEVTKFEELFGKYIQIDDFRADVINAARTVLNTEQLNEFSKEVNSKFAGSLKTEADLLGLLKGGTDWKISVENKEVIFQKAFRKHNFEYQWNGNKIIPKDVSLMVLNKGEESKKRVATYRSFRFTPTQGTFLSVIDKDNAVIDRGVAGLEARVNALRKKIDEVEKEVNARGDIKIESNTIGILLRDKDKAKAAQTAEDNAKQFENHVFANDGVIHPRFVRYTGASGGNDYEVEGEILAVVFVPKSGFDFSVFDSVDVKPAGKKIKIDVRGKTGKEGQMTGEVIVVYRKK